MADHADDDFDGDIFIYRRGRRAPQHITHALIDESVDEVEEEAFEFCYHLLTVDTHDGLRKIGAYAFQDCESLRRIILKYVVEIDEHAFGGCELLESIKCDRLERIGDDAFKCTFFKHLRLPSVITIGAGAFEDCMYLEDIEFSERLQTIGINAFWKCYCLQRIAIPLKRDLFEFSDVWQKYTQFDKCKQLTTVDLVGEIHTTVASLHMESWRTKMIAEINRINQVLPNTPADEKTPGIRLWIDSVMDKLDHYKAEHCRYVKEGVTLLELAVWKAKLGEKEESSVEGKTKKAKVDAESARKGKRITCGAEMVIKNVLPFLQLE